MNAPASVREATTPADVALARSLCVEYAVSLGVDLCFQGFDTELATLPGAYASPRGRLLLAGRPGEAFGCIALRPLDAKGGGADSDVGEVKRLYVKRSARGEGWGRRLAERLVADARTIGYAELKLDTLEWMTSARMLYASLGFRECAPYYDNPLPGVVYMSLALDDAPGITSGR